MMKNFAVNNMSNSEKGIYHQNGTVTATEIHPSQQEMDNLKLLVESGSSDEALKQARELSEIYAGSFLIWDTLGVYLSNNGDIDPALDAFQKSISLEPGYRDAYDHLAVTLNRKAEKFLKKNMFAKAKQFYERSLKIKIENPLALNNIGCDFGKIRK